MLVFMLAKISKILKKEVEESFKKNRRTKKQGDRFPFHS